MLTLRRKLELVAHNKEKCEEHPSSKLAQNSIVARSQEDYINDVFEEIEGRLTKKLSPISSRTESRILAALSRLNVFSEPTNLGPLQDRFGNVP